MFEILPNPSFETVMMVGRAALLLGAFWIFALAFSRWRRADERQMQHLAAQLQRTFAEVRSLHETIAVMSARLESLASALIPMLVWRPLAQSAPSAAMTWLRGSRRTVPLSTSSSPAAASRDTRRSC